MQQQLEEQLQQAEAQVKQQHFASALVLITDLITQITDHKMLSEAYYLGAVCYRYQTQFSQAQQLLDELANLRPDYGRLYQERGHCFKAQSLLDEALQAYTQAVHYNSALLASWRAIFEIHQFYRQQDHQQSLIAKQQIEFLTQLPPIILSATSLFFEQKIYKSEQLCRHFLQQQPQHLEAMRLLAKIGSYLSIYDDAEYLLAYCRKQEPQHFGVRLDYIDVLQKRQKFELAYQQAQSLFSDFPKHPHVMMTFANQCMAIGQFSQALILYQQVLEQFPAHEIDQSLVLLLKGHALKTIGEQQQAIFAYHEAYKKRSNHGDCYWSLANLKTYRFSEAEFEQMQQQLHNPQTTIIDRYHLCFALGKGYEDQQAYDRAFEYYAQGNELKRQTLNYQPQRLSQQLQDQRTYCTKERLAPLFDQGHQAADPIFIVGLPRAGSTLLEQILASHSQIDGTLELPNILALAHRLGGRRYKDEKNPYPENLAALSADELQAFGQQYIEDTRIHRQQAPYFIDKMPNNFRHIGLIKLILPQAKIIDIRRDPMACCFSGFKQLFAEGQEFSYRLEDIGNYYVEYIALMTHWQQVFPGQLATVCYEDLVFNLEEETQKILNYLGLPFEESCLNFYETQRSVRTPSSEQVRSPLNQTGLKQWQNFSAQLAPLQALLAKKLKQ